MWLLMKLVLGLLAKEAIGSDFVARTLDDILGHALRDNGAAIIYAIDLGSVEGMMHHPLIHLQSQQLTNYSSRLKLTDLLRMDVCVIQQDSSGSLGTTLDALDQDKNLFNSRAKFVVITPNGRDLGAIFGTAAKYFIYDLTAITDNKTYTYEPYFDESVQSPNLNFHPPGAPKTLPKKWRNTTVSLLLNLVPPYVICHNCSDNPGIELEIFRDVSRILGFSLKTLPMDSFEYWGDKIGGDYNNLFGRIQRREVDSGLGCFHSKFSEHKDFDMSFAYMEDGSYWVVPRARMLPYWKRFGLIFRREVNVAIGMSIAALVVLFKVLYRSGDIVGSFLVLFQILIESTVNSMPRSCVILSWTCSCLILSTIFKSKLVELMLKATYEHQIDSLGDIVSSPHLEIIIDHDIASFFRFDPDQNENLVTRTYKFCPDPRTCINRTAFRRDSVTVDFQRSNEFFIPKHFIDGRGEAMVHLIANHMIFPVHIHVFFVKGYPIFEQIDRLLMEMKSNGVVQYLYERTAHTARMAMRRRAYLDGQELSMKQIQIDFLIWVIGICGGLVVFLGEILVYRLGV